VAALDRGQQPVGVVAAPGAGFGRQRADRKVIDLGEVRAQRLNSRAPSGDSSQFARRSSRKSRSGLRRSGRMSSTASRSVVPLCGAEIVTTLRTQPKRPPRNSVAAAFVAVGRAVFQQLDQRADRGAALAVADQVDRVRAHPIADTAQADSRADCSAASAAQHLPGGWRTGRGSRGAPRGWRRSRCSRP
jgi:hypothetical protein